MNNKIIIYISVLIAFSNSLCIPLAIPQFVYYGWFALLGLMSFFGRVKLDMNMLLYIVACILSILGNNIPDIFQSEFRLLSFCVMIWAIGPLNKGEGSLEFKWSFWRKLNQVIVWGTVISFFGYLVHFPLFNGISGFNGFTNHSMTMSSLGGISFLILFYLFFNEKDKEFHSNKKKWIFLCGTILSILVCFLGASRGALISTFIAIFFYLWFYLNNIVTFIKYLIVSLVFILLSSPIWYPYTEQMREKTEQREESGGQFSSREAKWTARLDEFVSSPILGIGFASIDYQKHSDEIRPNGGVEPGSSWFFILSSVGLLGFLFFIFLIIKPIMLYCINSFCFSSTSLLVISLLVWRVVHLSIEGYIMAAGDFSFIYTWLLVALANDVINKKNI